MSTNLKNTFLIFISLVVIFFGLLPNSYAIHHQSDLKFPEGYKSANTYVQKAIPVFHTFKQIPYEPNSPTEESEDIENEEDKLSTNCLVYVNAYVVLKQFDIAIKVQYEDLIQSFQQSPKISLFILFHSWKSHQA